MGTIWKDGYSADVKLYLVVGNEAHDIAQVGPDCFVLAETRNLEPCVARLIVEIDGRKTIYPIAIDGASVENPTVNYVISKANDHSQGKIDAHVVSRQTLLPELR